MAVYEAVLELVGTPPAGYEIIVWCICAVFTLYLLVSAFSIVGSVVQWMGGR